MMDELSQTTAGKFSTAMVNLKAAAAGLGAELLPMVLFAHLFRVLGDSLQAPSAQNLREDTVPATATANEASPSKTEHNVFTVSEQDSAQKACAPDRRFNLGVVSERGH
jgi:hypothetical protein